MQILCEYSLFACKCEYEISYLCTFRTVQKNVSKFHTSLVLTDPLFKILTLPNLNIKHLYLKWVPNLNVPILAPQFQTNLIFEQARKCSVLKLDTGILDHWDWNTGHRGAMHGLLVHYWTPPQSDFQILLPFWKWTMYSDSSRLWVSRIRMATRNVFRGSFINYKIQLVDAGGGGEGNNFGHMQETVGVKAQWSWGLAFAS